MAFEDQDFENKRFNKIVCPGQDLSRKEFSNCRFEKCDFSGCKFSGSLFVDCVFSGCDLSNIKVDSCGFQNVEFDGCKLLGVIFEEIKSIFIKWAYKKCSIALCDFSHLNMKNSRFLECTIRETDFVDSDLAGSDLSGSDLQSSKFQNTNLEKADFRGAKNYYIDPTRNKLKQALFSYPEVLSLLASFGIKVED
jgi:uncharacterized protein YjbI with pentapeptide repeats